MTDKISRRTFLEGTASTASVLATGALATGESRAREAAPTRKGDGVVFSRPHVKGSQVDFRLGLARGRSASYPMDSMDFIMMDLERPDGCSRHAHWCTGDLTGRLLEFLSCAEGVDGRSDPRLPEFFERILKQRRPSGLFGRYGDIAASNIPPEDQFTGGAHRLFSGLIRYYETSGDARALEAATGVAERLLTQKDKWHEHMEVTSGRVIQAWVTEPFARLFHLTGQTRYLDFVGMIAEHLGTCDVPCHSHGFLSTLRGLQVAATVTGDKAWNEKPELNRRMVIERKYEMPDGCVSEGFPSSVRNEGCSIADWMMLNLNAGRLSNDDAAYDRAERIFYNALAFNQWVTGGFGHRSLTRNGYGTDYLEESWWCCLHDAGMAMAEYTRHAVTFRDNTVCVNLLVPGTYVLKLPDGASPVVSIATDYPASASATVTVKGLPDAAGVKVRIPACVRRPQLSRTTADGTRTIALTGELGHTIEECNPGVMLLYGPLVLAPLTYRWDDTAPSQPGDATVPAGYIPKSLSPGTPSLALEQTADADGLLRFGPAPLPDWSYFDEGPCSRCSVAGAPAQVSVRLSDGSKRSLRFSPLCYATSNLSVFETPVVFSEVV